MKSPKSLMLFAGRGGVPVLLGYLGTEEPLFGALRTLCQETKARIEKSIEGSYVVSLDKARIIEFLCANESVIKRVEVGDEIPVSVQKATDWIRELPNVDWSLWVR